jgi:hypothetical protein
MIEKIKYFLMGKSREAKFRQFLSITRPSRDSTLLDVGVTDKEYSPFDNYLEKNILIKTESQLFPYAL